MSIRVGSSSFPLFHRRGGVLVDDHLTLVGRSRAGNGTSFAIPELKWVFDCGALVLGGCSEPVHIFLTHTHADHITFLPHFQNENNPPSIHVPAEALPFIEAFLQAHQALIEMAPTTTGNQKKKALCHLYPAIPNQEFRVRQRGGVEYVIIPIQAEHRIICNGYSIFRVRKRLKEEYANLPGHEIGKLRKQGTVGLYQECREPVLCYIGDTTHHVFERHLEILQQHFCIVTECSFITEKEIQRADETKHTHWKHLKPIVQAHPQTLFLLIHFSLRHSPLTLLEFFNEQMELGKCHNVHPMLVKQEIAEEWRKRFYDNNRESGESACPPPPTCQCFRCKPQ